MTGRPRKPLAVRAAEGDKRKIGRKKLAEQIASEPRTRSGLPACPSHLTGLARETWDSWKQELEIMEMDKTPDAQMLEGACVAYQRAVGADCEVSRDGISLRTFDVIEGEAVLKEIKNHPAIKISLEYWKQVKSFCTEFGFTPASRSRLAGSMPKSKQDDLLSILSGPRADGREAIQ